MLNDPVNTQLLSYLYFIRDILREKLEEIRQHTNETSCLRKEQVTISQIITNLYSVLKIVVKYYLSDYIYFSVKKKFENCRTHS
jgi:hypothetical protein